MENEPAVLRGVAAAAAPAGVAAASAAPVLRVRDLTVQFATENGTVEAVRGLSYDAYPGEVLAIVGESGSGKSVSSLAVMGLLARNATVKAEALSFDGIDLCAISPRDMRALRGRGMAMIFQDPMMALNPVITIGEQLMEPLRLHLGMSPKQARERALELLGLVRIPDAKTRIDQYPHQFSGGMRQRVMIAIGLACNPKLLIADEPTTALDVTIQAQILELMQDLCRRLKVALVFITHNLGVVAQYADRVLVMYGGSMLEQGPARTVFTQPRHLYTAGLLASVPTLDGPRQDRLEGIEGAPPNPQDLPPGCAFAPRCSQAVPACRSGCPVPAAISAARTQAEMAAGTVKWLSGAGQPRRVVPIQPAVPAAHQAPAGAKEGPLMRVESLEKTYTLKSGLFGRKLRVQALRNISLDIGRRETIGVVGESGCGKSTLGRLLLRLEEPTGGRVLFRGEDITHRPDRALRQFRRHVQVVFQDPYSSLNPRQRIQDILTEPMRVHRLVASAGEAQAEARRLLEEVGLRAEHAERFPHQLSGGQRQRVAIARALAMQPELIVCDEAVSALDVSVQAQVVNLLADLQDSHDLSYLVIGHDLAVVRQIATRVVVMYLGRVVEVADRDDFYREPLHPYSRALMAAVPGMAQASRQAGLVPLLAGEPPSPLAPPSGCAFRTRCPKAVAECAEREPALRAVGAGRQVACLRID
jgi:peptide/nickel transport system ATP-binding protein